MTSKAVDIPVLSILGLTADGFGTDCLPPVLGKLQQAHIYRVYGNYELAQQIYETEAKDTGMIWICLGLCFKHLKQFPKALDAFKNQLKLSDVQNIIDPNLAADVSQVILTLYLIRSCYKELRNISSAKSMTDRITELVGTESSALAYTFWQTAKLAHSVGEPLLALEILLEGIAFIRFECADKWRLANMFCFAAHLARITNNRPDTLRYLKESDKLVSDLPLAIVEKFMLSSLTSQTSASSDTFNSLSDLVSRHPSCPIAYYRRANFYFQQSMIALSIHDFDIAYEMANKQIPDSLKFYPGSCGFVFPGFSYSNLRRILPATNYSVQPIFFSQRTLVGMFWLYTEGLIRHGPASRLYFYRANLSKIFGDLIGFGDDIERTNASENTFIRNYLSRPSSVDICDNDMLVWIQAALVKIVSHELEQDLSFPVSADNNNKTEILPSIHEKSESAGFSNSKIQRLLFEYYSLLQRISSLSALERSHIFACQGELHREVGEYEAATKAYQESLKKSNSCFIALSGLTLLHLHRLAICDAQHCIVNALQHLKDGILSLHAALSKGSDKETTGQHVRDSNNSFDRKIQEDTCYSSDVKCINILSQPVTESESESNIDNDSFSISSLNVSFVYRFWNTSFLSSFLPLKRCTDDSDCSTNDMFNTDIVLNRTASGMNDSNHDIAGLLTLCGELAIGVISLSDICSVADSHTYTKWARLRVELGVFLSLQALVCHVLGFMWPCEVFLRLAMVVDDHCVLTRYQCFCFEMRFGSAYNTLQHLQAIVEECPSFNIGAQPADIIVHRLPHFLNEHSHVSISSSPELECASANLSDAYELARTKMLNNDKHAMKELLEHIVRLDTSFESSSCVRYRSTVAELAIHGTPILDKEQSDSCIHTLLNHMDTSDICNKALYFHTRGQYSEEVEGQLLWAYSDYSLALVVFEYGDFYFRRALLARQLHNYEQAISDLSKGIDFMKKILSTKSGDPQMYSMLTRKIEVLLSSREVLYEQVGEYELCLNDLSSVISSNPDNMISFSRRSLAYTHLERYDEALSDLDIYTQKEPGDFGARLRYSNLLAHVGMTSEALEHLNGLLCYAPESPEVLYYVASAHFKSGDFEAAIEAARKCLSTCSSYLPVYLILAQSYERSGMYSQAFSTLKILDTLNPDFPGLHYTMARVLIQCNEYEAALRSIGKALAISAHDIECLLLRAFVFVHLGKYNLAKPNLNRVIQADPNRLQALFLRAYLEDNYGTSVEDWNHLIFLDHLDISALQCRMYCHFQLNRMNQAENDAKLILSIDPKNSTALCSRGLLKLLSGKLTSALEDCNLAIKYNSCNGLAYLFKAECLIRMKNVHEGTENYTVALEILTKELSQIDLSAIKDIHNEENLKAATRFMLSHRDLATLRTPSVSFCEIYNILGVHLHEQSADKQSVALAHFSTAVRLSDDGHDSASFNKGVLFMKNGQCNKAMSEFANANSINPNRASSQNNYGVALERAGRLDEAAAFYSRTLELNPEDECACYNLANIHCQQKQYNEAIRLYTQHISTKTNDASAFCNRGVTYSFKRMYSEALNDLSAALAIRPDWVLALFNRAHIHIALSDPWNALQDIKRIKQYRSAHRREIQNEQKQVIDTSESSSHATKPSKHRSVIEQMPKSDHSEALTDKFLLSNVYNFCIRWLWGLSVSCGEIIDGLYILPFFKTLSTDCSSQTVENSTQHLKMKLLHTNVFYYSDLQYPQSASRIRLDQLCSRLSCSCPEFSASILRCLHFSREFRKTGSVSSKSNLLDTLLRSLYQAPLRDAEVREIIAFWRAGVHLSGSDRQQGLVDATDSLLLFVRPSSGISHQSNVCDKLQSDMSCSESPSRCRASKERAISSDWICFNFLGTLFHELHEITHSTTNNSATHLDMPFFDQAIRSYTQSEKLAKHSEHILNAVVPMLNQCLLHLNAGRSSLALTKLTEILGLYESTFKNKSISLTPHESVVFEDLKQYCALLSQKPDQAMSSIRQAQKRLALSISRYNQDIIETKTVTETEKKPNEFFDATQQKMDDTLNMFLESDSSTEQFNTKFWDALQSIDELFGTPVSAPTNERKQAGMKSSDVFAEIMHRRDSQLPPTVTHTRSPSRRLVRRRSVSELASDEINKLLPYIQHERKPSDITTDIDHVMGSNHSSQHSRHSSRNSNRRSSIRSSFEKQELKRLLPFFSSNERDDVSATRREGLPTQVSTAIRDINRSRR